MKAHNKSGILVKQNSNYSTQELKTIYLYSLCLKNLLFTVNCAKTAELISVFVPPKY